MRVAPGKSMNKAYTHRRYAAMRKKLRKVSSCSCLQRACSASARASSHLVLLGVDEQRLAVGRDHLLVDHHLADVLQGGQLVHRVEQHGLEDRAQAARAGLARERLLRHRAERGD